MHEGAAHIRMAKSSESGYQWHVLCHQEPSICVFRPMAADSKSSESTKVVAAKRYHKVSCRSFRNGTVSGDKKDW